MAGATKTKDIWAAMRDRLMALPTCHVARILIDEGIGQVCADGRKDSMVAAIVSHRRSKADETRRRIAAGDPTISNWRAFESLGFSHARGGRNGSKAS